MLLIKSVACQLYSYDEQNRKVSVINAAAYLLTL